MQTPSTETTINLALTFQQILIAIWTVGSMVMIPMIRMLINTLNKLEKATERLTNIVVGIEGGGESLVDQVKRHEFEIEDDREYVKYIVNQIRAAKSLEALQNQLNDFVPRKH